MSIARLRKIIIEKRDAIVVSLQNIICDNSVVTTLFEKYSLITTIMYITVKYSYQWTAACVYVNAKLRITES